MGARLEAGLMCMLLLVSSIILWVQLACGMDALIPELIQAVTDKKPDRVLAAINAGADVNEAGPQGDTALMYAAHHGHIEICLMLIKGGANFHQRTANGKTALSIAIDFDQTEVVTLLVKNGADINMAMEAGHTPLMALVRFRISGGKIPFLLELGADSNRQGRKTLKTGLMYAVRHEDEALCALLLKHGARVDLRDKKGQTALILAARSSEERICELLVNHQAALDQRMITFLCSLKHSSDPSAHALYRVRKDVFAPYLKPFSLQLLLNTRGMNNYTAYNYLQLECLNFARLEQLIENGEKKKEKKVKKKKMGKKNKKCVIL